MSEVFYKELIILDDLAHHLRQQRLVEEEVLALLKELEETLHVKTLDFILEELPEEHHEEFMIIFSARPGDAAHWDFLHNKVPGLKEKIVVRLQNFKQDLIKELQ